MFSLNTMFFATVVIAEFTLLVLIRPARELFRVPGLGVEKSIGYSQFFAYPIFFDFILFALMVFIPVVVSLFFGKILKRHD